MEYTLRANSMGYPEIGRWIVGWGDHRCQTPVRITELTLFPGLIEVNSSSDGVEATMFHLESKVTISDEDPNRPVVKEQILEVSTDGQLWTGSTFRSPRRTRRILIKPDKTWECVV